MPKYDGTRYRPNPGQRKFHSNQAAIRLLLGGRGAGKSASGAQEAGQKILDGEPGLIVAPDTLHFKKSTWVQFNDWLPIDPEITGMPTAPIVDYWSKGDKYIRFKTGSQVWYGGVKNPDSWRGPNVNWIWYDEPGRHPLKTSFLVLVGCLRAGEDVKMWLTTTPRGVHHWLYPIFVKHDIEKEVLDALEDAGLSRDPNLLLGMERTSTWENRHNLNPIYFAMLLATYKGLWREQELEGKFVSFEGLVYPIFDPEVHVISAQDVKIEGWWPRYRVIDFGYTNPLVCQWWAKSPDNIYYMYREIYMTKRTVREHAQAINHYSEGEHIVATICDHDAEDRATLHENGIDTMPAIKDISPGLQSVYRALELDERGKSRLYFIRDALVEEDPMLKAAEHPLSTIEEFPRFSWPEDKEGKASKEIPVDLFNHGMDCVRYLWMTLEGEGGYGFDVGPSPTRGYRG